MKFDKSPENYFLKCKDHTVSGQEFELRHHKEWDLLSTFPKPGIEQLPEYYKSEKYISHTDSRNSVLDKIYHLVKFHMTDKKLEWIEKENGRKGKILDIGAGTGDFLARAKVKGWEVEGIEPNARARELAGKKGVFLSGDAVGLQNNSFDVISMWHVLEHIPNLEMQINELRDLLKDDGLLVIAVPNFKSYDAKKYGQFWAAYDVPRHLWHFSRSSIKKIFKAHDFSLVHIKPLKFDAYYVSLLSEKNKNGSGNFLSGLVEGFISNLKARKSGEYSSLTYFLKRK